MSGKPQEFALRAGPSDPRGGCWPVFLGMVLGLLTGAATGFLVGVLDAPEGEPDHLLEWEWYTAAVLFVLPFLGGVSGVVLGGLGSVVFRDHRPRALVGALGGVAVGVTTGWRFRNPAEPKPGGHLFLVGICCAIGATLAVALAPLRPRERAG